MSSTEPCPEDVQHLRRAIELAAQARAEGNHPFGAVLVQTGSALREARNTAVTDQDVTCHAEMNLIRQMQRDRHATAGEGATLYASTEPCAMCAGAVYWAGIRRVVYSVPVETLAELAPFTLASAAREIFTSAAAPVELCGPLLPEEGRIVHEGFWNE